VTETYLDLRLDEFIRQLAAGEQAPGGGSAAALTVALASALVSMVARSSRTAWDDAAGVAAQANKLLDRIAPLMRADAQAWGEALAALQGGGGDEALERKLDAAAAVPIEIARAGADTAVLAAVAAELGEGAYRADAAVAAVLAAAGARAAAHLVAVNLAVREDDDRLAKARRSAEAASESAAHALDVAG
jgi:formiminotetrahydrofolate cyclodeaminase